jgi:hypothetical protein
MAMLKFQICSCNGWSATSRHLQPNNAFTYVVSLYVNKTGYKKGMITLHYFWQSLKRAHDGGNPPPPF